jgi:hypothetical protein
MTGPLNEAPMTIQSVIGIITSTDDSNSHNFRSKKRQRILEITAGLDHTVTTNSSEMQTNMATTGACKRIAKRLYRIEPSNASGICSTVSAALNAHLVVLGDTIYNNCDQRGLARSISIHNDLRRCDSHQTDLENHQHHQQQRDQRGFSSAPYYYEERIIEEEIDYDSDEDDDEYENNSHGVEPILNWFYYDEPDIPAHPALEYETGRLVVVTPSPTIRPKSIKTNPIIANHPNIDNDVLLLDSGENTITTVDTATNASSSHDNEFFDTDDDDEDHPHRIRTIDDNTNNSDKKNTNLAFEYPQWQFHLAVLFLVATGSLNVVTAKAQSISM